MPASVLLPFDPSSIAGDRLTGVAGGVV